MQVPFPQSDHPRATLPHIQTVEHLSDHIKHLLADFKQSLQTLYDQRLTHLVLYGSVARNEATPDSDVDVLVVLSGTVNHADEIWRMGEIKTRLLLEYDELISVVPMTEQDFLYRDSPLLQNIRQEGILL
ncbi:MAG: nucleotidyltransferase domain-containing protein [Cyanobacteria bacterium J06628_6]